MAKRIDIDFNGNIKLNKKSLDEVTSRIQKIQTAFSSLKFDPDGKLALGNKKVGQAILAQIDKEKKALKELGVVYNHTYGNVYANSVKQAYKESQKLYAQQKKNSQAIVNETKSANNEIINNEKKTTQAIEKELNKRVATSLKINSKFKNVKNVGSFTSGSYSTPNLNKLSESQLQKMYGTVQTTSYERNASTGAIKYANVLRQIQDTKGNIIKTTLRQKKTEDGLLYVSRKTVIDERAKLNLQEQTINKSKEELRLEKEIASLTTRNAGSKGYQPSFSGGGTVVNQSEATTRGLPEGTQKFLQQIDNGKGQIETWTHMVDKAGNSLGKFHIATKEANRDHKTFGEQMSIATRRIAEWGIATNIVYGSLAKIREGLTFLNELDNKMNEIRIVTGMTASEAKGLSKVYNELASKMGVTTMDVANMSTEFYRQGLSQDEVNERMKETIKYSKIAGITTEETAKILTASANSYGVTGKGVEKLVDVLSYLGDASASGADEVGRGMQKVAASGKMAGLEYEWLASKVAVVSETTRESAETIGNSLKSILVRYSAVKKAGMKSKDYNAVTTALKSADITAIDKQTGQLRNFQDVIDELGGKWEKLTPKVKSYIATALAG
jgi:TP901 family phage tail tape measure protein